MPVVSRDSVGHFIQQTATDRPCSIAREELMPRSLPDLFMAIGTANLPYPGSGRKHEAPVPRGNRGDVTLQTDL